MPNQHPISISEKQFKAIATRLREDLSSSQAVFLGHASVLQILSHAIYSKPYEEARSTLFVSDEAQGSHGESEVDSGASTATLNESPEGKYLRLGKSVCPFCDSRSLDTGEAEVDSDYVSVTVSCDDCGEEWEDLYGFSGVSGMES